MINMVIMVNIGMTIDVERVKDEIRRMNPAGKTEICRWIDHEAAVDLVSPIGVYRSREKGVEQKRRVIS
jgi:hypothetical protein